jgi:hypothetical protein
MPLPFPIHPQKDKHTDCNRAGCLRLMQAAPASNLVQRLRDTANKGVSVWGELQLEAATAIDALKLAVNQQANLVEKCMIAMNENADLGKKAEDERDQLKLRIAELEAQRPAVLFNPTNNTFYRVVDGHTPEVKWPHGTYFRGAPIPEVFERYYRAAGAQPKTQEPTENHITEQQAIELAVATGFCLDNNAKTLYLAFDHEIHEFAVKVITHDRAQRAEVIA